MALPALIFIPQQLGPIELTLSAHYADGGYATQTYHLNVIPAATNVSRFLLNSAPRIPLVLDGVAQDQTYWLAPRINYKTLQFPIYLANSKQLTFRVEQSGGASVVKVDPDGMIHALNPGTATITGNFDGVVNSVVVTVYPKNRAPAGYIFHKTPEL